MPDTKSIQKKICLSLAVIAMATFLVYVPALNGGFVNYDDNIYITENPTIKEFSAENLRKIFTTSFTNTYVPLTILSFSLDYHFVQLEPWWYHLNNILLHVINTLLVFWLIYLLIQHFETAVITATLFGIHTLHVESVAWLTERKDVLYTVFFLASLIAYLLFLKKRNIRQYRYSLIFFLISLFSKGQAVTLPLSLLLIDYFSGRKLLDRKVIFEKIPFFALSIVFGIVTICVLFSNNVFDERPDYVFHHQLIIGSYAFVHYLIKLIFPYHLSALYPLPVKTGETIPVEYWVYPLVVFLLILLVFYSARYTKKIVFGTCFFIFNIFLMLQILPVGTAFSADRFSYVSSIGFFYLIAVGYKWIGEKKFSYQKYARIILISYIIILAALSYNRCHIWKDGFTLWNDVLTKYPDSTFALNNRGYLKLQNGDIKGAVADFDRAILASPRHAPAYHNRGICRSKMGDYQGAIADYTDAVKLNPNMEGAFLNRGSVRFASGNYDDAIRDYSLAIQLKPDHDDAFYFRGLAEYQSGRYQNAISDCSSAIILNPRHPRAYYVRGMSKIFLGESESGCLDLYQSHMSGYGGAAKEIRKYCRYPGFE